MASAGSIAAREQKALQRIDLLTGLIAEKTGIERDTSPFHPTANRDPKLKGIVRAERDATFLESLAKSMGVEVPVEEVVPTHEELEQIPPPEPEPAPEVDDEPDTAPDHSRMAGRTKHKAKSHKKR